jgi:hypothetical protein
MTATPATLGAGYFAGMYAAAADPWGFEDRRYERRRPDKGVSRDQGFESASAGSAAR